jgi:hypothetical protein
MAFSKTSLVAVGLGALALALGIGRLADAAAPPVGDLANNEGIYVELKTFKVHKGMAKTDPQAQITKLGARPVNDGAIIFRAGDKLYIVDAAPGGTPMYLLYEGAFAPGG